ncbi:MAG: 23S rRNA (pseudouridine(1915)-N(3))-methyltransferase RlmH [Acidobacteria bacterium]|nr:23S rRNA (pseudouridine(1915)-N(3))-methyltransferase RlmH [Acidobacteriota bacterium]
MKIYLYYIGKDRDPHANAMAQEYVKRTDRYSRCEMREIRPERFDPWQKHPSAVRVLLDSRGREMASEAFTAFVGKSEREARDLVFVIGGADGLPAGWAERADVLLSLSPMTFPHELARVMLAEQIYRAFTALRGHPYAIGH